MNTRRFLVYTAAATLLAATPLSVHAGPQKMTKAQVHEAMSDPDNSRMALEDMMQDKQKKKMMAKMLAKDKDFREYYNEEVGNNAPHEERNPSQHPELFKAKKPAQ